MIAGPSQEWKQLQGDVPKGQGARRARLFWEGCQSFEWFEIEEPVWCAHVRSKHLMQHGSSYLSDKELVDQEIERLRVIDNEREKMHKQKMKGEHLTLSSFLVSDLIAL